MRLAVRHASRYGERWSVPRGLLAVGRSREEAFRAMGEGGLRSAGAGFDHPELKGTLKALVVADGSAPGHAARSGVTWFGQVVLETLR